MSKSYRIRTKVGVDTSLKVLIEQEFEHLEILSLKILQSDIYTRQCADYGVIVGRVSVNNGFGIPNAKISIFIPIDSEDQTNPIISELYPYKTLMDTNDDGYRYNLLPYVKSYSAHVPTGTFFTRTDVLTDPILIEVYDKYYKYNATTNDSGDYMIFGVPVGSHTLVMDVDLSDIGEFSLSPQDLIRMGLATEAQVSGVNFKSSNNLRELPQIINLNKSVEVEPLWGQPEICNLGITRTDFDLSSEANVDIRPTSIFMGSIISGPDSSSLSTGCRPPSNSGHLCNLTVGPGEILSIRQTIQQDSSGRPILENFSLESGGKVIDENGAWLIDVPMNMDYYTTNEFGEQVLSNDPEVGVPTKGKYRFKIKWSQSPSLSQSTKRGYFLVPNIKEYGNPNFDESYSFSTDWNDYAYSGATIGDVNNILSKKIVQEAIDCEDRFYMMQYNKVYTVSQFISYNKSGNGIERYIGIKNILDETCSGLNNKFPTNDGNFRFDIIYIIFMFFSIILTPVFFALILILHILYFVVWILRTVFLPLLALYFAIVGGFMVVGAFSYGFGAVFSLGNLLAGLAWIAVAALIVLIIVQLFKIKLSGIKVPILTYPDCELCPCKQDATVSENIGDEVGNPAKNVANKSKPCPTIVSNNDITSVTLSPAILPLFTEGIFVIPVKNPDNPNGILSTRATVYTKEMTGLVYDFQYASNNIGAPILQLVDTQDGGLQRYIYTTNIPVPDRVNLFNVKAKYFNGSTTTNPGGGVNRISVNFQPTQTANIHYDNTTVIFCDKSTVQNLNAGQLLAFQNPTMSKDINSTGGVVNIYGNNAITGVTSTGVTTVDVTYAKFDGTGNIANPIRYFVNITADTTNNSHKFPTDIEYFQVITGMTYSDFSGQCSNQLGYNSLNNRYLNNETFIGQDKNDTYQVGFGSLPYQKADNVILRGLDFIDEHENICVLILNRGVDPYTPKVPISYGLGRLFGYNNYSGKTVTGLYHMNIPIQGKWLNISHLNSDYLGGSNLSADLYSGQQLYFNSFSYQPQIPTIFGDISGYTAGQLEVTYGPINSGYSGFSSNLISYYSAMDNRVKGFLPKCGGQVNNVYNLDDKDVANFNSTLGLNVHTRNRFTWRIRTIQDINFLSPNYRYSANTVFNGGYFVNEIVEGGPIMFTNLNLHELNLNRTPPTYKPNGKAATIYNVTDTDGNFYVTSNYYSKIYDTTGNTLNFSSGASGNQIVMRGDRLPTSTNVDEYCCNGMVLQKNPKFQMYLIPEEGVLNISSSEGSTGSAGSGDTDYLFTDLSGSTGVTKVFNSFTCNGSVNLACYECESTNGSGGGPNSTVKIKGHKCQESFWGETIFEYGCYRFISTIFLSLATDWSLMFEWIARNMVMLGACRNVFSHRFVNNWVNGVLYAFPFKNEIKSYGAPDGPIPNQPIPSFCAATIKYDFPTKNYYYRVTPYNNTTNQFEPNSSGNMGFPTTIMDLGPRTYYIQELVMSDDYDGYVVNKLNTSSYGPVDDILNLFIISRFIDSTFLSKLLGSLNILAYFTNGRGGVGNGGTKLMIDADYSQLISINSELGVAPFVSSNYPDNPDQTKQNPIFFNCNNVLGIFFSSDTQIRDYITPKREIINPSGGVTSNCSFNNFPVYSQRVPLSQWSIEKSGNIFGKEDNNWNFKVTGQTIFSHRYQSLDRLDPNSRYFRNNGSTETQYQKGYIYAVETYIDPITLVSSVDLSGSSTKWDRNTPKTSEQLVTVGAPFHFYFGLRRGASSFDRFRTKWINTDNIVT